jgi:YHS domain-containing protein
MSNPASDHTKTDPVCGAAVGDAPAFHMTVGGIERHFCSRACQDLFSADPARYAPPATPGAQEHDAATDGADIEAEKAGTAGSAPPVRAPLDGADDPPSTFGLAPFQGDKELPREIEPAPPAPAQPPSPGFFARLLPGSQGRFARRVSRELQTLHGSVAQAHPTLHGLDLYRRVIMERMGIDQEGADNLLRKTDENFAWWPTTRAITFIDVVHMIALQEYHAVYGKSPWIRADMARIIAEEIDHAI